MQLFFFFLVDSVVAKRKEREREEGAKTSSKWFFTSLSAHFVPCLGCLGDTFGSFVTMMSSYTDV